MSSFGNIYRAHTFGESHCKAVGVVVDGVPPGLPLTEADIQPMLSRRRPGQSKLTTPRDEKDQVVILSGTEMGVTLGTPIAMMVNNLDQRPHDYSEMDQYPRPSHADYTYLLKYGVKASSGGGRSSARETIGRVAAAAVAEKYLKLVHNIEVVGFVGSVGSVSVYRPEAFDPDSTNEEQFLEKWHEWWKVLATVQREDVDKSDVRCPIPEYADKMRERIVKAKEANDSIGGTVVCVIRNLPVGLGEPAFEKLEAKLAQAMLSIPATKGFEVGSGFAGTDVPGHLHNDPFVKKADGSLGTKTNFSGGIQGGISNGEHVYFRVAFKPPATIGKAQPTASFTGTDGVLEAKGRHDPCVLPRAVPIVESMALLAIMDALMEQLSRQAARSLIPQSVTDALPPRLTGKAAVPNGEGKH
ncbi:chorismate synthase [Hyaloraphidium curvatum]|nr:chorismate synthase [Hyaloraphidium curvatum]